MKEIFREIYRWFVVFTLLYCLNIPTSIFAAQQPQADPIQISVLSKPFDENEKKKYALNVVQPYAFDLKHMVKILSSLAYQKRDISWSNKRRVFNSDIVPKLAPLIVEQFARTNPDQRTVFQLKNSAGKIVLQGDTFLTSEGLHWRMTVVQKRRRKVDDFSVAGESWRLVPLNNQSYKTKQRFKGLVEDITNWIVFPEILPKPSKVLPLPSPDTEKMAPGPSQDLDVKSRLRILEDLKKEGLVNEEEYRTKRREILKDL